MIHEIAPEVFDNQYRSYLLPEQDSRICIVKDGKLYLKLENNQVTWPTHHLVKDDIGDLTYLFSISQERYFLAADYQGELEGFAWYMWQGIRDLEPKKESFAIMTAYHLYLWYANSQYCGKCGGKTEHSDKERMMRCSKCGNMLFPVIAPAVIVAVIDKEKNKILLTNYSNRASHSLVAGFVEIGETLEECCAREVLEETGVKIKNIRFYDSQPWGYAKNLMIGFLAELDGSTDLTIDENELSAACWLSPEEIPEVPELSSLTRTMIHRFKEGTLL